MKLTVAFGARSLSASRWATGGEVRGRGGQLGEVAVPQRHLVEPANVPRIAAPDLRRGSGGAVTGPVAGG